MHNNTPDLFSVTEYAPGNKRSVDSKKVYINTEQDADDFFLTTDNNLYEKLADKGFNTILQDNKNCTEDGSLSVYCGKKNIRYVNCETEHGKTEQYYEMIKALDGGSSIRITNKVNVLGNSAKIFFNILPDFGIKKFVLNQKLLCIFIRLSAPKKITSD